MRDMPDMAGYREGSQWVHLRAAMAPRWRTRTHAHIRAHTHTPIHTHIHIHTHTQAMGTREHVDTLWRVTKDPNTQHTMVTPESLRD